MNYLRNERGQFARMFIKQLFNKRNLVLFWVGTFLFTGSIFAYTVLLRLSWVDYTIKPVKALTSQNIATQEPISIAEHICLATDGENCDVLVNLARCESSLNPDAWHVNTNKSVDLGLFQWNSVHFKTKMTPACALDVYCSARATNEEIKNGNGKIWVCWKNI